MLILFDILFIIFLFASKIIFPLLFSLFINMVNFKLVIRLVLLHFMIPVRKIKEI